MQYLAQLKIPGAAGSSRPVPAPSGIPGPLQGGLFDTGSGLLQVALNWFLVVGVVIATVMMIISGIQWITSSGDTEKIRSAKSRLIYSIIGLVIILGSYFIVGMVIRVFGGNPAAFFKGQ